MSGEMADLARTIEAMRPMVPARDFEISKQFYVDIGFRPEMLTNRLAEMHLGAYSFMLQDHYVREWADNLVMHMRVTDVNGWWDHIRALDLPSRFAVKSPGAPKQEDWGLVLNVTDPSGVLWRIAEAKQ